MSIVPRNFFSDNGDRSLSDLWDHLLSQHDAFFSNFQFPFHSRLASSHSVPYSEVAMESESEGSVSTRLECREIEDALIFVVELPADVGKESVKVEIDEDTRALRINGGGATGRFSWRFKMPAHARIQLVNSSVENGVLTVVVPKVDVGEGIGVWAPPTTPRNVRVVEIEGSD